MARHGITTPQRPIILSLENSGMCGSIALTAPGLCVAEYSLTSQVTHSKRLLTSIDFIMGESRLDWPEIDAIAVSLGPGSFTGLRIGLTTAKGLVMATGGKLIGIHTLTALAAQAGYTDRLICPMLDARKQEVYTALYRYEHGKLQVISPAMAIQPQDITELVHEPAIFIGDGSVLYKEIIQDKLGETADFANPEICFPRAAVIGSLALEKWRAAEFLDPASAVPAYVRASDAEIMLKKNESDSGC